MTIPERIKQALSDFGQLDGLIIDNRMNAGVPVGCFFRCLVFLQRAMLETSLAAETHGCSK